MARTPCTQITHTPDQAADIGYDDRWVLCNKNGNSYGVVILKKGPAYFGLVRGQVQKTSLNFQTVVDWLVERHNLPPIKEN